MLVLSRKRNETILIGPNVTITVLEVRGATVRLGIDADRSVLVLRGELVHQQGTQTCDPPRQSAVS